MSAKGKVETERKFDVDETVEVPPLRDLAGVHRVERPDEYLLISEYFDTPDFVLAARRITLRRRDGGDDAGWHLKIPLSRDDREELREPLSEDPSIVPQPLLNLVRVFVRNGELIPVAHIQTRRQAYRLLSVDGRVLAEFCDDRARSDRHWPDALSLDWREWEIELVNGSASLLDATESMLAAMHVSRASYGSKLARALADHYPSDMPVPPPQPERQAPALHVLLSYVHEQVRVLMEQDSRVRVGAPDSVHLMRITTRRLRSTLTSYRTLLDPEIGDRLCTELQWLAGILGAQRDAEVIHERLRNLIGAESSEPMLALVSRRIDARLGGDFRAAQIAALEALDGDRYFHLLDDLDELLTAPPLTELAYEPARRIVPKVVNDEWIRLRRAVRVAERTPSGADHDFALHEVRKCAKRLRYAAETAESSWHKRAIRLAKAAERLQTILGDHHDSVVAGDVLRLLGRQAYLQGENAFPYGRLHALEQHAAENCETQFFQEWKRFPSATLKI